MKKTLWVITREINEYDQDGEYFLAVFSKKPTVEQLNSIFQDTQYSKWLLETGGGRENSEHTWYYLSEIIEGAEYKCIVE